MRERTYPLKSYAVVDTNILQKLFNNMAPTYSTSTSYSKDDCVIYEGLFYVATGNTSGTFNPDKWTATDIKSEIIDRMRKVFVGPVYSSTEMTSADFMTLVWANTSRKAIGLVKNDGSLDNTVNTIGKGIQAASHYTRFNNLESGTTAIPVAFAPSGVSDDQVDELNYSTAVTITPGTGAFDAKKYTVEGSTIYVEKTSTGGIVFKYDS